MMAELSKLEAAPLYEYVCKELKWPVDAKLMASLKEKNKESLESMDSAISDAKENLGESEVRESLLKKADRRRLHVWETCACPWPTGGGRK